MSVHTVVMLPLAVPVVPAGQVVHDADPAGLYCPEAHGVHDAAPAALLVPAAHGWQVPANTAAVQLFTYEPALQERHTMGGGEGLGGGGRGDGLGGGKGEGGLGGGGGGGGGLGWPPASLKKLSRHSRLTAVVAQDLVHRGRERRT